MISPRAPNSVVDSNAPIKALHVMRAARAIEWRGIPPGRVLFGWLLISLVAACSDRDAVTEPTSDAATDGGEPDEIPPGRPDDPSCNDQQMNNQETDVDCGGSLCAHCDIDRHCGSGADCLSGACDDSLCMQVSGPPFWLPGVSMTTPRSGLGAATYVPGDLRGKLVVVGGYSDKPLDTYEVFDPDTSRWTGGQLPSAPCCRLPAVTGADGRVYLVYGDQHQTWAYDGAWNNALASPPPGCVHAGLALGADSLLYALCSHDSLAKPNPLMTYDTVLNRWAMVAPTPTETVNAPWVTSLGGRIYVLSTSNGNQYAFGAYDIASGQWSTLAAPALPSKIVGAPDGRVYVVAGFGLQGQIYAPTEAVRAYSPETNRWTSVAPLRYSRYDHDVTVGPDGRLYALGGYAREANDAGATDTVEVYGPVVSLSPSEAAPGQTIRLTGSNFAARAKVRLTIASEPANRIEIGKTDAQGALPSPVEWRVPSLPSGTHTITVVDDKSRYPITLRLSVR